MKNIILALLTVAVAFPGAAASQTLDATKLTGRWQGSGVFFKADLRDKVGSIPFVAEFKADRTGTGSVGAATMQSVHVGAPTRSQIEVTATLAGAIGPDPALAKDHLVLLITAITDSTMQAEFHLKSNSIFDLRMREGSVTLTRVK